MYATIFKKDPLDPVLGKRYRDKILRVGGSREETESLNVSTAHHLAIALVVLMRLHLYAQDFLGRPPNSEAFLKELFGTIPASNL